MLKTELAIQNLANHTLVPPALTEEAGSSHGSDASGIHIDPVESDDDFEMILEYPPKTGYSQTCIYIMGAIVVVTVTVIFFVIRVVVKS
jgi:hypothetical protein